MNYIDLILGVLLILGAIRGFMRGFVAEFAGLAALVLGVWGAIHFSYLTSGIIIDNFNYHPEHLGLISFLITFLVIVILVHLVAKAVENILSAVALGFLNKLAGVLFGVIKTALILSVLLMIFDRLDEDAEILPKDTKEESQMYEPIKNLVPSLLPFLDFWDIDKHQLNDEKNQKANNGKVA
ncbi:MAG TPA: CvpA family protein [Sunxiuqinia sp.]|nr:CvpA family protein [Sunxiuqinia sp.]